MTWRDVTWRDVTEKSSEKLKKWAQPRSSSSNRLEMAVISVVLIFMQIRKLCKLESYAKLENYAD